MYRDEDKLLPNTSKTYRVFNQAYLDLPSMMHYLRAEYSSVAATNDLMEVRVTFKMRYKWLGSIQGA